MKEARVSRRAHHWRMVAFAHICMRLAGQARTVIQRCASRARLQGGRSILREGARVVRNSGRPPLQIGDGPPGHIASAIQHGRVILPLRRRPDAIRRGLELRPPWPSSRRDEQLERQRHEHCLACAAQPSAARTRNECAEALPFWKLRKRQTRWILPCGIGTLPARAKLVSGRRLPFSTGEPAGTT